MSANQDIVKKRIKAAGLRATPQRIYLLDILMKAKTHPSAEMLMNMSDKDGFSLSIGTVYNTLETFEKKGLVNRVHDSTEVMRYDGNTGFHVHLIDRDKNTIMDYMDEELEGLIMTHIRKKMPKNFSAQHIDLSLYS